MPRRTKQHEQSLKMSEKIIDKIEKGSFKNILGTMQKNMN